MVKVRAPLVKEVRYTCNILVIEYRGFGKSEGFPSKGGKIYM